MFREIFTHLQSVAQANQRGAQFMGNPVDQLFFTGNQRIDIVRHLIKSNAQPFKTGAAVKMQSFTEMTFTEPLGGGFQSQHFLPVWTHPDKHRKGQ